MTLVNVGGVMCHPDLVEVQKKRAEEFREMVVELRKEFDKITENEAE
jgi:hypothetical protein